MGKDVRGFTFILVISILIIVSCSQSIATPTPQPTLQPSPPSQSCKVDRKPTVPKNTDVSIPDETGLLIILDITASTRNCSPVSREILTRFPIFSLALSKNFSSNDRPYPHIAISTYDANGLHPVLPMDDHLNQKNSPMSWYEDITNIVPGDLSGENYGTILESGLSGLSETDYKKQRLLIITDGSFIGNSVQLSNQISEGVDDISVQQEVDVLLLCPAQVSDLTAWENIHNLDGKIKIYRTDVADWFQVLVKQVFDGFLLPDELDNFISSGQVSASSMPALGVHQLHSVSLYEGAVEQNPGKNFLTDGEIPVLKSINVRHDFSKGTCGREKKVRNLTQGDLFYWYSPLTSLAPNVDIKIASFPNDNRSLKITTFFTIPQMSNGELLDELRCIQPVLIAQKGNAPISVKNASDGSDVWSMDTLGRVKSEWVWDKDTPPDTLQFIVRYAGEGNELIFEQTLFPKPFVRKAATTNNDEYWTLDMDVWFPSNLIDTDPLKALSDEYENTSKEADFPIECAVESKDTNFYPGEYSSEPYTDSKDVIHPIVYEWTAAANDQDNMCRLQIDILKDTLETCKYNRFQVVWPDTSWECALDDSSDSLKVSCSSLP